ncbi:MAG: ABC transporter ATP-binding protein [Rhodobacteraceae bacterium]|jgi:flagellar assembly protein FliH|uniref:ABC transporter ATP-binding protein n=1 Tax=Marivita sp. TaxID=2003365 RepID=UPI003B5285CB|nr:ABC transporter ATP-binding protein [Paracoccaceae bacterium]
MTSLAAFLEDFGTPKSVGGRQIVSDDVLENERLEAFEKGYRAGWDDAIEAKGEEGDVISDGILRALQDMSFTYHEVHAQVLSNLGPLFDEILQKTLPRIARDSLGAHVADQLAALARDVGTVQIEIAVAPGASEQVSQLVNGAAASLPVTVCEAPDVPEGRADLRLGRKELTVDLNTVTEQIADAVHAVLYDPAETSAYG